MELKVISTENKDDCISQKLMLDGKEKLSVSPLWECPEDAIIGRDLISCNEIADLMALAFKAGKNGEEFNIIIEVVDYKDFEDYSNN